jgi:hypothetical protein
MEGATASEGTPGAEVVKSGALAKTYTAQARRADRQRQQQGSRAGGRGRGAAAKPKARLRQLKAAREQGLIDGQTFNVAQRALAAEMAGLRFTTRCTVSHPDGTTLATVATTAHTTGGGGSAATPGLLPPLAPVPTPSAPPHDIEAVIARLSSVRVTASLASCMCCPSCG